MEICIKYNKMATDDNGFWSLYCVCVRWKWHQMKEYRQLFCKNDRMTFDMYQLEVNELLENGQMKFDSL